MYDRAAHAGIRVVAGTIVPYNTATADQNERMRQINAWIREQVRRRPGDRVRRHPRGGRRAGNPDRLAESPDGLHPSPRGYRQMADAIRPVLAGRLARYPVRTRRLVQNTSDEPHYVSATRLSPARALAVGACALTLLAVPTGAQIKVSTQTVPLYVTVTDTAKRLVPDLAARGLRDLRQRQAADADELRQQGDADQRRRHARHERQHDARARSREAGGRRVPDPPAARGQGQGRRVQRQDRGEAGRPGCRSRTIAIS